MLSKALTVGTCIASPGTTSYGTFEGVPLPSGGFEQLPVVIVSGKLDGPTYSYDNEGHIHVPPQQPGRLPPALSPPRGSESETVAAVAEPPKTGGTVSNWFGGLFASKATAAG